MSVQRVRLPKRLSGHRTNFWRVKNQVFQKLRTYIETYIEKRNLENHVLSFHEKRRFRRKKKRIRDCFFMGTFFLSK